MKPIQLRPSKKDPTPSLSVITPLGVVRIEVGVIDGKHRETVTVVTTPDSVPGSPMILAEGEQRCILRRAKTAKTGRAIERRERWLVTAQEKADPRKIRRDDLFLFGSSVTCDRTGRGIVNPYPHLGLIDGERHDYSDCKAGDFRKVDCVVHDSINVSPVAVWVRVVCDKEGNYIRPVAAHLGRPKTKAGA